MRNGDRRTITLDGVKTPATYLGRGHFATAYLLDDRQTVILYVKDGQDNSKHILSDVREPSQHIPTVVRHEDQCIRGRWFQVWAMPFYEGLTAEHQEPWAQYKILKEACERVRAAKYGYGSERRRLDVWGLYLTNDVIEDVKGKVPESLTDALRELNDSAANYGSGYTVEFAQRNLSVKDGALVLRDILFDAAVIQAEIERAYQRRLGR